MTPRTRLASHAALVLALLGAPAPVARAADAAPDTTLDGYVRSMADSTDRWFGLSAGAVDTTGLDSLRAHYQAHPAERSSRRRPSVSFAPAPGFNRVLGPVYGATASLGAASEWGTLAGSAQWAAGARRWLGNGSWSRAWANEANAVEWRGRLQAGRWCDGMDRDFHWPLMSMLRAFLLGTDRSHYLRVDGAKAVLARTSPRLDGGVSARAMLETPLPTTATWYLTGHSPQVRDNIPAAPARVREVGAWGAVRPRLANIELAARLWSAGGALGGDADYTRLRLSAGQAQALGRHLTLATQADYGRLTGTALPQDAFFLGGTTLYSVGENSVQGTGRALGRTELLLVDPLQRVLGLEHDPLFPIQLGAFAGSGACWGFDPATGLARLTRRDWPEANAWRSEAGVSVMYRPGLPDPDTFVRVSLAWPIGPGPRGTGIALTYTRPLGLLKRN